MLDSFTHVLIALWHQDFTVLQNPDSAAMIYLCIVMLIWLESAFLPAAPLPCDSVVILSGSLAAAGIISLPLTWLLLIIAAATGSSMAFMQGRWLHKLPKIQGWIDAVPSEQLQTADKLLTRHGLLALFSARFIPVVRSLLPLMMGLRIKKSAHFQYYTWLSACVWSGLLLGLGYSMSLLPQNISKMITMGLIVAPVLTLGVAITGLLTKYFLKRTKHV